MEYSPTDHTLNQKVNLNKFKSIEAIESGISDYNGIKLETTKPKTNKRKQENL